VRFGEAAPAVLGRLRDLLGIPTEDEAIPCDGAQRRWVRWADLSIVLERGRFVAWTSGIHFPPGPQPLDLATPEGLAAGDAVSVLGEAYGGTVTLTREPGRYEGEQWEFRAVTPSGPISGVIEGDRAAGRVVAVSAGAQCRTAGR
jgi:hypothetical protein